LPTIGIAANRADVTNLQQPLMYTRLARAYYNRMIILTYLQICLFLLCFKPSRILSVAACCHSPCLMAVGFYSRELWLCLFGSLEPWLECPTCIYGFGNAWYSAYPCRMGVQSFDRLFTSGPMHSAVAVMHCFWNLGFFFYSVYASLLMNQRNL